ncbi:MAG: nicotinamidase-related amidase [Phenylobacterium sp.]|jgi:nicotinamidase-related amidase
MLHQQDCGLILVDVQGRLASMVQHSDLMITNIRKLIQCCQLLSIPIIWLEQNPAGLGGTIPQISELLTESTALEKHHFNGLFEVPINQAIKAADRQQWLVAGIEAHICVYQTVLGLLADGLKVEVVSDCISSRLQSNIDLALSKMRDSGASISSLEMAVFELMKSAKVANFKDVLTIIK